jgi:transposase
MGAALTIRGELGPGALRRHARREPNRRAALRMLAIANALEGMSRAGAAGLAGMERQALRDAVVRYNAEGLAGLYDRPKPGRPERLSEAEQAALAARVFTDPDPERDGAAAWTRADLCRRLEGRFGGTFHPSSLSRVLGRLEMARPKTRPVHPEADPKAGERFRKRAAGRPRVGGRGQPRQAPLALLPGRGQDRAEGPALPPLVAPGRTRPRPLRPALRVDVHLRRRPSSP